MPIFNEYSKINQVILGINPRIYPDFDFPEKMIKGLGLFSPLEFKLYSGIFKNRPLPKFLTSMITRELEAFVDILKKQNVNVHRLEPIMPLESEHPGLLQMFARDPVFTIGNKVFVGNMAIKMRRKEYRGYEIVFKSLENSGYEIIQMPKEKNMILEGGDVIVDHPYVFAGFGTYISTLEGIKWLQSILKDEFEVIPIEIKDKSIMHLDCCLTIIGKNRGIIHRNSLKELPQHFKNYDFIEVDSRSGKQLETNVFVIDPETIVVQARHKKLINELIIRGYKVHPVKFNLHVGIGGAFRCTTCPLDRD